MNTDLKTGGLKGKVKSVKQQFYDAHDSSGIMVLYTKNRTGELFNGKYCEYYLQQYDEKGNIIVNIDYLQTDSIGRKTTYKYDANGNLIELISAENYTYDTNKTILIYDKNNNCIEENHYYSKDWLDTQIVTLYNKYRFKYDEKGNEIEEKKFNYYDSASDSSVYYYKYDEKGRITEMNTPYPIGSTTKYKYDKKGNRIEECIIDPMYSFTCAVTQWKYDSLGNATEAIWYNYEGKIYYDLKYEYEYDKHGNCIKKTQYDNGKLQIIYMREIEYYQ